MAWEPHTGSWRLERNQNVKSQNISRCEFERIKATICVFLCECAIKANKKSYFAHIGSSQHSNCVQNLIYLTGIHCVRCCQPQQLSVEINLYLVSHR